MASTNIRRTSVDEFAIHFIRKEIQIIFLDQISYLIHFSTRVKITRWVVRVANQNGTSVFIDEFFKLLHCGQSETIFYCRWNRTNFCSCRNGKGHIIGIRWFGNDNFIARIETREKGKEHSLRTTCCYDNVINRKLYVVGSVILHQLLAIRKKTLRRRIF